MTQNVVGDGKRGDGEWKKRARDVPVPRASDRDQCDDGLGGSGRQATGADKEFLRPTRHDMGDKVHGPKKGHEQALHPVQGMEHHLLDVQSSFLHETIAILDSACQRTRNSSSLFISA